MNNGIGLVQIIHYIVLFFFLPSVHDILSNVIECPFNTTYIHTVGRSYLASGSFKWLLLSSALHLFMPSTGLSFASHTSVFLSSFKSSVYPCLCFRMQQEYVVIVVAGIVVVTEYVLFKGLPKNPRRNILWSPPFFSLASSSEHSTRLKDIWELRNDETIKNIVNSVKNNST